MIRINLLPYRAARKKENIRTQLSMFFLSLLLVIGALAYGHFHLKGKITSLNARIDEIQRDIIQYNKIVTQVEKLREEIAALQKKLDVIKVLDGNREEAFRLLDTMTKTVIEGRMWFTDFEALENETITKKKIEIEEKPKKGETDDKKKKKKKKTKTIEIRKVDVIIKVRGIALDNKTVADFMTRLEAAEDMAALKLFKNVKLVTLELVEIPQGKEKPPIYLKSFEITCLRMPPKASDIGKDKKT
jgi:type IV pilus assembly protein PilN